MLETALPSIEALLASPGTSHWLKSALRGAIDRDPVDAANDSELLAAVLAQRAWEFLDAEAVVAVPPTSPPA